VRVEGEAGMKNKERIMTILDEIESLYPDRTTEHLVSCLQKRVEWAYEYAENCDLYGVLTSVGHYNWLGGLYRGLKESLTKRESGVSDVFDKIEDKIRDAEFLLVNDLVQILKTKCGREASL
jgi:hypothetical protein